MKELLDRLKTESPAFFKRIQWIVGILTAAFGVLQTTISFGFLPKMVPYMPLITNIITGLAGAFGVSFLAKKDPAKIQDGNTWGKN